LDKCCAFDVIDTQLNVGHFLSEAVTVAGLKGRGLRPSEKSALHRDADAKT
jgi:hypothetical protein